MTKYLLLICLLIPGSVYAGCINQIAASEVQKAINLEPNAGGKACGLDDPCVCFDGIDWRRAQLVNGQLCNSPLSASRRLLARRKALKARRRGLKLDPSTDPENHVCGAQASPSPAPAPSSSASPVPTDTGSPSPAPSASSSAQPSPAASPLQAARPGSRLRAQAKPSVRPSAGRK